MPDSGYNARTPAGPVWFPVQQVPRRLYHAPGICSCQRRISTWKNAATESAWSPEPRPKVYL